MGDTVNFASRIRTGAIPGVIHITKEAFRNVEGNYKIIKWPNPYKR